ncbi:hypothetical protein QLH51_19200 [Sphingomonas sp. 2R-10]|uniref:hypothetical protein n=1 Tax=Sphingomonas sp. 2R-10 TaxID=3045148 RepID=UPI000F78FEC1|nr:hypothetical protein [Sphingomonas sp. 2R-10]MDJ0278918.1 hypothetical protein [Sphingomonas sp. 2R-10]
MSANRSGLHANLRRFGAAHATRSLGWSVVDLLLAWHLHAKLGLSGTQTGWLMLTLLAAGGTATFLVGLAFARNRATGETVVRVQFPASMATGILLVLQFQVTDPGAVLAIGLAFRVAYGVQDVSQNMLSSLLPADEAEAACYARIRVALSAVTRCCVVTGFALLTPAGSAIMLGAIAIAMIVSAWSLRDLVFPVRPTIEPPRDPHHRCMPPALAPLLVAWMIAATVLPTLQRLLIFAPALDGSERTGAWLLVGFCAGSVIGPMISQVVNRVAVLAMIVASGAVMILPLQPGQGGAWWSIAGAVVHGVGVSIVGVSLWAATSRVAMTNADAGRSGDGVVFGSVILTIHLASAGGMLVLGPLIEGFEAGRQGTAFAALALTILGAVLLAGAGISGRTEPATAGVRPRSQEHRP